MPRTASQKPRPYPRFRVPLLQLKRSKNPPNGLGLPVAREPLRLEKERFNVLQRLSSRRVFESKKIQELQNGLHSIGESDQGATHYRPTLYKVWRNLPSASGI